MTTDHRAALAAIKTFPQLVAYLRDEMNWPIERDSFEDVDDLFYDYTADELGIEARSAAKIRRIRRLRPLTANQPWGIFFVEFEPKKLPVVALRRILGQVVQKKRASAKSADRIAWSMGDLLFISNYGEGDQRQITFAHFAHPEEKEDLPTLKVLGWDNLDTPLHLDRVAQELTAHLSWPEDDPDSEAWRVKWRSAFALRHREVITTSKQLSIALAALARNIRDRINTALKIETDRGPLTKLMNAFRESLLHDLKPDDFADMYAQTIAYGLLSARIADPESKTADDFARHMRTNPFLRELMETFLHVGGRRGRNGDAALDFDELGVNDVVELLDRANMAAVVADFGDRNPQDDPVIHFYELFLKEYDAKKRMQRGVFYTPKPVVSYIVRSVDELLRTEFGLEDGLADTTTWREMATRHEDLKIPEGTSPDQPFVQILDPACGTGTFLVEVIDVVHKTLMAKWRAAGHRDSQIAALWNQYVPQFLLPRLHGYELLMAPYAIAHLKIGLKLHETGYHFGSDERARIFLTNALEPPNDVQFRLSAMPALAHEAQAVNATKKRMRFTLVIGNPPYSASTSEPEWLMKLLEDWKQGLNETKSDLNRDEWKFFRFAEHLCATAGAGLVGFIINRDFLDGITKRRMREHLGQRFPFRLAVDLNGDVKGNVADENVFEIEQGVAIAILATQAETDGLRFTSLVGTRDLKNALLVAKSQVDAAIVSHHVTPPYFRWLPFAPNVTDDAANAYATWTPISEVFSVKSSGIQTKNDQMCIGWSAAEVFDRVQRLAVASHNDAMAEFDLRDDGAWSLAAAQSDLRHFGVTHEHIRRILYRPFDLRFTYYTHKSSGFLGRPRYDVMRHMLAGTNVGLIFNRQIVGSNVSHFGVSRDVICHGTFYLGNKGQDYLAPLYLYDDQLLAESGRSAFPNFQQAFLRSLLQGLGEGIDVAPEDVFNYIYAVFHSPRYRELYLDFLKIDYPRLPLARTPETFHALATLGAKLVALHLLESQKVECSVCYFVGTRRDVERVSWSQNAVWLDKKQSHGFNGVTEDVWNFRIGGYQVCEKWLKDRKGRTLSDEDIAHYQKIVVAISATIRLMKEIDEVIEQHGGWPGAFQTGSTIANRPREPRLRMVDNPSQDERYRTCVPLVPLKAAATNLDQDPQYVAENEWPWVEVDTKHRLRSGMFVAQVTGRSMEPRIPDRAYCLFASPVEGSRQGKTVLVKLHRDADPESGANYTIKRYESEKVAEGDSWRHVRITFKPDNPEFPPIVFTQSPEEEFAVVAELVEVLEGQPAPPPPDDGSRDGKRTANDAPDAQQRLTIAQPQQKTASFPTHGLFAPRPPNPTDEAPEATDDTHPQRRLADQYSVDDVLLHVRDVVDGSDPIDREDAIREIARRLGAERTGSRIRELIESALNTASRRAIIETVDRGLIARTRSIEEYHRDFLKTALKNVVGRTWTEEDEAIRAATRWLGFRRTGHKIEQAFKSAIRGALRQDLMERDRDRIRFVE